MFHYPILKVSTGKILSVRNSVVDPYIVQIFSPNPCFPQQASLNSIIGLILGHNCLIWMACLLPHLPQILLLYRVKFRARAIIRHPIQNWTSISKTPRRKVNLVVTSWSGHSGPRNIFRRDDYPRFHLGTARSLNRYFLGYVSTLETRFYLDGTSFIFYSWILKKIITQNEWMYEWMYFRKQTWNYNDKIVK